MKWLKKHRKKGAFVILFAIMLTILWPIQTGIEIDSSTVPLVQKQLKEALVAATKSAAGQLDQAQLHDGHYVLDPNKATQAFDQIMQANLKVNPSSWEPQTGSSVKSPLHLKLYMYNQWSPGSLPGTTSTLLNTGLGTPSDSLYPPLQDVSIPNVTKPTILAVASETYTSFWGKKVVVEQFASAQVDYVFNGKSTSPDPVVQSVTFSGTPYDPTITVQGIGFGGFSTPYTGDPGVLAIVDRTRGWEQGNTGDSVTDAITSWSDTQIVMKPTGAYNDNVSYVYEPGDVFNVSITNPQTKNSTSYQGAVSYPIIASINATVNATYQNGYGNNSEYQVTMPFDYVGYAAGNYKIAVVDSQGNTVNSTTMYLAQSGSSQVSWKTTYPNAQGTWHLVETDSMGRQVAQSNSVTSVPLAPQTFNFSVNLSGQATGQNTFTITTTANNAVSGDRYEAYLGIYDNTAGQWVADVNSGSTTTANVSITSSHSYTAYVMSANEDKSTALVTSSTITATPGYYTTQQVYSVITPGHYVTQTVITGYTTQLVQTGGGYWRTVQTGGGYWRSTGQLVGGYCTGWTPDGWCLDWHPIYGQVYVPPTYSQVYVPPTYSTRWVPIYTTEQVYVAPVYGWTTQTVYVAPTIG